MPDVPTLTMNDGRTIPQLGFGVFLVPPGEQVQVRARLRLDDGKPAPDGAAAMRTRRAEADEFHAALSQGIADPARKLVQRQAFAGLLWTKQVYRLDVARWLDGDPGMPTPPAPFSPTTAWTSPARHSRSTPKSTFTPTKLFSMPRITSSGVPDLPFSLISRSPERPRRQARWRR